MKFVGVYRTDEFSPEDEAPADTAVPTVCLRRSVWDRELDLHQAPDTEEPQEYLTSGPQIAHRFVFANRATHPGLDETMDTALSALTRGVAITPIGQRDAEWESVTVELADERLSCRVEYSPLLAQSESLEATLPVWLARIEELLRQEGLVPDDEIALSIRRSVPELVSAAPHATLSAPAVVPAPLAGAPVQAVVVQRLPAEAATPPDSAPAGIHVDLPRSLWSAWLRATGQGIVEIDVRAIPHLATLTGALVPGTTSIGPAVAQAQAAIVGLTSFEQLWVKNRPVSEQLLRELPQALAAAHATDRVRAFALIDLSAPTVDAVLGILREAPIDEAGRTVPVFCYPTGL